MARTRRAGFHPCFRVRGCARRRSVPMQSRILALAVAGILSAPPLAMAEGAAATDLDEVVVTATRTEVALADSLFPVQVIEIGRAHVCTPVTNEQLVCRLLLEKKK